MPIGCQQYAAAACQCGDYSDASRSDTMREREAARVRERRAVERPGALSSSFVEVVAVAVVVVAVRFDKR